MGNGEATLGLPMLNNYESLYVKKLFPEAGLTFSGLCVLL